MSDDVFEMVVKCPHCGEIVVPVAEIDPTVQVQGSAELEWITGTDNRTGELQIDWDSLDADICFVYNCSECGQPLAGDLTKLSEMVRQFNAENTNVIYSTETCAHCGREFDYTADNQNQLVICPYCKTKNKQCNMCDPDSAICEECPYNN